jgi:hypothetical protein
MTGRTVSSMLARRVRNDSGVASEHLKKAPCQLRLSAASASVLESKLCEIHDSSGSPANQDLESLLAKEPQLDVLPAIAIL